jgi:hypothetical protein
MKTILKCLTGDLYPTGELRHRIFEDRVPYRKTYRKAPRISLDSWQLELFDEEIRIGDFVSFGGQTPFKIDKIEVKHIEHNSYRVYLIGSDNGEERIVDFECYGKTPIEFIRET